MQIFLGPQHPTLETKLVEEIRQFKATAPLKALLILVPSDEIRRRLMILLCREEGLNLVALRISTFHQISEELIADTLHTSRARLRSELFFEEMLRSALLSDRKMAKDYGPLLEMEGGPAALWSSFRDLKEGRVDPEVLLQAFEEGHFGHGRAQGKLQTLFRLYGHCLALMAKRSLLDYGDFTAMAIERVADASSLRSVEGIFYYGFYDLTQVQIDLFHEIARHKKVTLFFPRLADKQSSLSAERFFERYLEGLAPDSEHITVLSEPLQNPRPCTITHCYDTGNEVLTVAKEILKLRDEGIAFDQIGVISRDLSPYLRSIKSIFKQHAISITSGCEVPMLECALPALVFKVTALLQDDFPRAGVLAVLSDPRFNMSCLGEEAALADRSRWQDLAVKAKVTKGFDAWKRLENMSETNKVEKASLCLQSKLLWCAFSSLHTFLNALPDRASWLRTAECWQGIFTKIFGFRGDERFEDEAQETQEVEALISNLLKQLKTLDAVSAAPTRAQFIETFQRWFSRATRPIDSKNTRGVTVIDLMSARALPFQHLFLLGLNEGHFPRQIREDPFLPDQHRCVLETVLGYKVGEKLAAYDEENLLFALTTDAARTQLHVFTHRVDALGGVAAPSIYIDLLTQQYSSHPEKLEITQIPRSLLHRAEMSPFNEARFSLPTEWATLRLLRSQGIESLFPQLGFSSLATQQSAAGLHGLEQTQDLGSYDGLIGDAGHWATFLAQGLSPTALERYVRCPFQFYANRLLALKPERSPEEAQELAPNDIGELCHAILKRVYEGFVDGSVLKKISPEALKAHVADCSEAVFLACESEQQRPYPLHWESQKEGLEELLHTVVRLDRESLAESGFVPSAFEVACRQQLDMHSNAADDGPWPEMKGRIDRLDFNPDEGKVRVVDYKVTFRKSALPGEKNLLVSALRGQKLQAPIYQQFATVYAEEWDDAEGSQSSTTFLYIVPNWKEGPLVVSTFSEKGWQGEDGRMLEETLGQVFQGIKAGRFFMKPGDHCNHCEVLSSCRQAHPASRARLESNPHWLALEALKKRKAAKKEKKKR